MRSTAPSTYSKPRIRSLLKRGSLITVQQAEGGKAPVAPLRALSGA
jgi:hypothetical protein